MEDRIGKLIWRLNARLKFGLHYSENEESLKVYELRNDTIRVELQKDHLWVERMRDWNERETGSRGNRKKKLLQQFREKIMT